ncbi:hypothetical protein V8F20_011102 [Naviculisporaceae sp. PSN 640]
MADHSRCLTIPEWYELAKSHGATARYRIRRYGEGDWASEWCDGVQVVYPPGVDYQVVNGDMKLVPDLKGKKGSVLTVEVWYDYDTNAYSILIHDAELSILGIQEPDHDSEDNAEDDKDKERDEDDEDDEDRKSDQHDVEEENDKGGEDTENDQGEEDNVQAETNLENVEEGGKGENNEGDHQDGGASLGHTTSVAGDNEDSEVSEEE